MKTGSAFVLSGAVALTMGLMTAGPLSAADVAPNDVNFDEYQVANSLTGAPGDPVAGADAFKNRKLGNCLACHTTESMSAELFHGNVGPSLDGAGDRWSVPQLRAIVVDPKQVFGPDTRMPGIYSRKVGKNVSKKQEGQTIHSAADGGNIAAYLATPKT